MTFAVYTVCTGGWDLPKRPEVRPLGVDFICFTDDPALPAPEPWEVRPLVEGEGMDAARRSRIPKLLPHRFLPEFEYTVYADAYFTLVGDVTEVARVGLAERDLLCRPHQSFQCLYMAAEACVRRRKGSAEEIVAQMASYRVRRVPERLPMIAGGVLIRRRSEATERLFEAWWEEVERGSWRDELSFPVAAWRTGVPYALLPPIRRPRRGLYYTDSIFRYDDRTPAPYGRAS